MLVSNKLKITAGLSRRNLKGGKASTYELFADVDVREDDHGAEDLEAVDAVVLGLVPNVEVFFVDAEDLLEVDDADVVVGAHEFEGFDDVHEGLEGQAEEGDGYFEVFFGGE